MNKDASGTCAFLAALLFLALTRGVLAQGVTTAAINGIVTDNSGQALPGANVIAVHDPSGTRYGTSTRLDGRYNLENLRVGGPYTVTVTYVGFKTKTMAGVMLELSQNPRFDFLLEEGTVEVGGVEVTADRTAVINPARTGAAQNVSREQIERFPTIARSFTDFQNASPQFIGNSAAGRNNRFNNIQIDGTQYNDLFGLGSSGTPGGQASTNPISLDAIQEFQVVIAPYDVRQSGFTGGGVNAITRSGTNAYTGSLFLYGRNQDFIGLSPDTNRSKYTTFDEIQTGFRVGGPVIENTLFFFVNGELTERNQPTDIVFAAPGVTGANVSPIALDSVKKAAGILRDQYGYDPGTFDNITLNRQSKKFFARLDYNLAENHRLTLRHNFVDAGDDNLPRSLTRFYFDYAKYIFNNNTNSSVLQWTSTYGNTASNEFVAGYTRIRDYRDTRGAAFPFVRLRGFGSGLDLNAGTEQYSMANSLDQDIFEITDNFTYFMGEHIFTVGTHNEIFSFKNLYIRNQYGYYEFANLTDFAAGRPSNYQYSYSLTGDPRQAASFSAVQFGLYAQDEWSILQGLKLNIGLRVDIPTFPDKPAYNFGIDSTFGATYDIGTDKVPSGNILWAPRLGFNYDVFNDRTTQLRGGVGVFTGRVPYVWISNQYGNTGVEFARVDASNRPAGFFTTDPYNQPRPGVTPGLNPVTTSEVNVTAPDFKMPQVARIDVAVDHRLPYGLVATVEGIYSMTMNDIVYQDLNLGPQLSSLPGDDRPVYGTYNPSRRSFTAGKVNPAFTNVILMKNAGEGYQYNISAQVLKELSDGLYGLAGYAFGESKDYNSTTSSQAYSQWRYNHVKGDPNNPTLSYSAFDIRHRIFAAVSYRHEFLENWGTTISVFYNGQSGQPFSYVYDGDVNGDGQVENDLIYIPKDANDIILTTNNYDKLNQFIENDEALSGARGTIMERMSARAPWQDRIDIRIGQEIPIPALRGHRVEITFDALNFLNLLDGDWGYSKYVDLQRYRVLKFEGLDSLNQPTYSFNDKKMDPYDTSSLGSRWQMQIGLRYSF